MGISDKKENKTRETDAVTKKRENKRDGCSDKKRDK